MRTSVARSGILGSCPGDDDEPPSKISRAAHHQRDSEDLYWAAPDPVARFNSDISQQAKEKYDLLVARERLTQKIEEERSKTGSLLGVEMNRSGVAQNRIEDRASMQPRSLLDMEISRSGGPPNRNVDRLNIKSRVQPKSVLDIEMNRPIADWRDSRVTTTQPQSHGRDYQRAVAPYDHNDQMNNRLSSFDLDDVRSHISHASDRGPFDRNESPASLFNQGLPRERERLEWNKPGMFNEVDNVASDTSHAWNVANSRNDARAISSSLSVRSSSSMYDRSQWSLGERQEDLDLRSVGSAESRKWQGAGLPDAQKHNDSPLRNEPSDQTDTVSLLLNLSQLLA